MIAAAATLAAEQTSTGEAVQFWVLGVIAVVGAVGVVAATKAVYSALFLATTMIVLAVFYVAQGALFLGVVQIVVYTGAVMMLFLFVLMLVGVDSSDSLVETLRGQRVASILLGLGFGVLLCGGIGTATVAATSDGTAGTAPGESTVEAIAELIFIRYLWAFELTGALLITATLGAMVLAHRERLGPRRSQRERSIERFRAGIDLTPLPNPGVFARHNAVDVAALLPDGTPTDLSVSATLRTRTPATRPGKSSSAKSDGAA
ncbi:MAG: NADH-quinone oxidoreductase subunit J [Gordonia sp. (in: high G+C Gram-positive bacteria)]